MKDTNAKVDKLKGVVENYPQPIDALQELVNWQVDQYTGGWTNRLGYEKYNSRSPDFSPFLTNRVDSMFYVQRHQGAQDSILFEQNGTLYQLNDFNGTLKKNILSDNRTVPRSSEVGTQYCQFGRYILYVNGYDRPSKSRLWLVTDYITANYLITYPLGFDAPPSAPVVWGVNPNSHNVNGGDKVYLRFDEDNIYNKGLGAAQSAQISQHKYKVTFVNTAGSESPFSSESNVVEWETPSTPYRYAVTLEIPTGNNDVIARRIYRTKNFSPNGGADPDTYYFLVEIPNNADDFYIDDNPDSGLGSEAPSQLESIPFPALGCRYLGSYKDCLFIDVLMYVL